MKKFREKKRENRTNSETLNLDLSRCHPTMISASTVIIATPVTSQLPPCHDINFSHHRRHSNIVHHYHSHFHHLAQPDGITIKTKIYLHKEKSQVWSQIATTRSSLTLSDSARFQNQILTSTRPNSLIHSLELNTIRSDSIKAFQGWWDHWPSTNLPPKSLRSHLASPSSTNTLYSSASHVVPAFAISPKRGTSTRPQVDLKYLAQFRTKYYSSAQIQTTRSMLEFKATSRACHHPSCLFNLRQFQVDDLVYEPDSTTSQANFG